MFKVENFGVDWIEISLPFPCEIHHCFARAQPDPRRFRVLSHFTEPRALKWSCDEVRAYAGLFDLILTNDERLLDLPNSVLSLFGSCWVTTFPVAKRFEISFLYSNGVGSEQYFAGYRMRRQIWNSQQQIAIPRAFYTSVLRPPESVGFLNPFPGASKELLFESMFSVIVENEAEPNWFTEKIIDAFRTYTVPIYFGAPNIGDYFDLAGIIVTKDSEGFLEITRGLTVGDYWSRMASMHRNFEFSRRYMDVLGNIKTHVQEAFDRKSR